MTMSDPSVVEAPPPSFVSNLADVYMAPTQAFSKILQRPSFWAPLLLWTALVIGFSVFIQVKADPREAVRTRLEEMGIWDRIPPERQASILEDAARPKVTNYLFPAVLPTVVLFVVSGASLLVFAFLIGAEVKFKQIAVVVSWTFLAVALVTLPLTLLVLGMKGDWNIPPETALQANLSLLLDKAGTSRVVYALAESADLFSAWTAWLLAAGFGVATRRSTGAALPGVLGLWALWIAVKLGLLMIFGR
jgi:hypothetical protein